MFLSLAVLDMLMDRCDDKLYQVVGTNDFFKPLITILNKQDVPREVSTAP